MLIYISVNIQTSIYVQLRPELKCTQHISDAFHQKLHIVLFVHCAVTIFTNFRFHSRLLARSILTLKGQHVPFTDVVIVFVRRIKCPHAGAHIHYTTITVVDVPINAGIKLASTCLTWAILRTH